VEPGGTDVAAELDRIESAVRGGATDLRALGFWRLVGRIKRDPALVEVHADQVGRIDTAAFRGAVWMRIPVWLGNLVFAAAIAVGAAAIVVARVAARSGSGREAVVGWALVLGTGILIVAVHTPTHWLIGRIVGLSFTSYFVKLSFPPWPGIKIDYATYLRADPMGRAWMHASGAIANKITPLVVLALAPWGDAPAWSLGIVGAIAVGQVVTDVLFSVRVSDWKRFFRERAIAREGR
jgi:hypothetical protein